MRSLKVNRTDTPNFHIKLGSGFILLFSLIFFFDDNGFLLALLPAVLIHEMGHILIMLLLGAYPTRLNATLSGFAIDYTGILSDKQELLTALSGPVFGLLFSLVCAKLGSFRNSEYLLMCGGLGLILNLFNLLPAMPLDGGRALGFVLRYLIGESKAQTLARFISLLTALLLIAWGLYLLARGFGFALFFAGSWLFILQQNKYCK
ncbi:MAG: hypothetical protein KBI01_06055 [Oscillospiraceae bacterium]|nr:hypothetical protein [Oscillospiraceae bacterium]